MKDGDRILLLNALTGRVHKYEGALLSCGCPIAEESLEHEEVQVITDRHLSAGIWQPAPCLLEDPYCCPNCDEEWPHYSVSDDRWYCVRCGERWEGNAWPEEE